MVAVDGLVDEMGIDFLFRPHRPTVTIMHRHSLSSVSSSVFSSYYVLVQQT